MKRSSSSLNQMPAAAYDSPVTENFGPPPPPPPPISGEEITHLIHSKHPLMEVTSPDLFTCAGCKDYGAGKRFSCQQCDFQLHQFCAHSAPLLTNHPLHPQHQLVFHSKPKQPKGGIMPWPRCDICGKTCKGFTYRCRACSFQMHPCCALLSTHINFPLIHPHPLKMLPPSNTAGDMVCGECKKLKRSGRMYRCTVCEYHLHALCAKTLVNGLHANGITAPEKPSVLGAAARLASQVVIEFIGGLIEGLGEGVGEVLVQNLARGRCSRNRRVRG